MIYASGAEGIGATLIRVDESAEESKVEELWKVPHLRNHFNSSVPVGGHIYGFDNATLKCIDPATGGQKWAKRGRMGKGSLIYADGHLLVLTETGRLLLVDASPEGYVEKAATQVLEGRCWTAPALSGGRLFLRNRDEMLALDLRAAPAAEGP